MSIFNKFIKATEEYNTFEKNVPAPYIRKSFESDIKTEGEIYIACCGFYELYINGKKCTKGYLAPYISNTDDYIYYDRYKVTVEKGENVIGLLLGNGFQNNPGGYIWDFDKAPFRSAPKAAAVLKFKDGSGKEITVESDSSFKTAPSAIRSDDYRFGVHYDADFEIPGWNLAGFDDSRWQNAIETAPPRGELKLCEANPIVRETEIKPVNIYKQDDGYVYDFGISYAGICRLKINGSKGQKIEWQHADFADKDSFALGRVWFVRELWERDKNIVHKDSYICKGGETEIYEPPFTYHGFRFVKIKGITEEQAVPELLTFVVLHSDLETRGGFRCSDSTVNTLQEMTRRSDLSNFYYFPTDCPQREKNGWTGDAALSCEQILLNFAAEKDLAEWFCNICKAQDINGALPGIVPTTGWGFAWGNGPSWDRILAEIPYNIYKFSGDTEIIKKAAASFVRYLNYLTVRKDEKGLMHIGLGDWCQVGGGCSAPLEITDTVVCVDIAEKMAMMFDAVGMKEQKQFAQSIAEGFRAAIREHLIDFDTMTAAGCCQTSQAMCIYHNIFNAGEKQRAFERLLEIIHRDGDRIAFGIDGARVLFHVLSDFGYSDLALDMIIKPGYPSYAYWIEQGATTLWEDFNENSGGSMNHHFFGDISGWFIRNLAGIQFNPTARDIHSAEIRPFFAEKLDCAEGFYNASDGRISSGWKRDGEKIVLTVEIPEAVNAVLLLPDGYECENGCGGRIKSGEYSIIRRKK